MSQKSNQRGETGKNQKSGIRMTNRALQVFLAGCVAECYLLLVRRFYVNGTLEQVVAWDTVLRYLAVIGLGIAAVGLVWTLLAHKKRGTGRLVGVCLLGGGLFLAAASWLTTIYYTTVLTPLSILVPVAVVLGILWYLYDRECFYALLVLGLAALALWSCRKGVGNRTDSHIGGLTWNTLVLIGCAVFLVLVVAVVLLVRQADRHGGKVGKVRLLNAHADGMPIYVACGISAVAVIFGMFSATLAYYALLGVGIVVFALLVYYTVKQL